MMPNLVEADVTHLDTSDAEDIWAIFWNDSNLTKIDGLDQWHTGKVKNVQSMFQDSKFTSLDLSSWDTSHVTNMNYMFYGTTSLKMIGNPVLDVPAGINPRTNDMYSSSGLVCAQPGRHHWVKTADVTNLDTTDATLLTYVLNKSTNLETVTGLGKWNTGNATDMRWIFQNCSNVKAVDLQNWDTSKVGAGMMVKMLPSSLQALRLGPKTKLLSEAFSEVPSSINWQDKTNPSSPVSIGNTAALASRAAGTTPAGTYIADGQADPFPPINTPVSALPFTGDSWQTMVKGLMLLMAAGLVLGIVTYAHAKRLADNK